jgi:hypothetical protein
MDNQAVRAYLTREKVALEDQLHFESLLSLASLRERGIALANLKVLDTSHKRVHLVGDCSSTRIRPGDVVQLQSKTHAFHGTVAEISVDEMYVEVATGTRGLMEQRVNVLLSRPQFYAPVFKSLNELRPGTPGYGFARQIAGDRPVAKQARDFDDSELQSGLQRVRLSASTIDASQVEALRRCLRRPSLLGVQGPPGTGKTRLLALVAAALSSAGREVAITAYTNQAVDNALNAVHTYADARSNVLRIGGGASHRITSLSSSIETLSYEDFIRKRTDKRSESTIIGLTLYSGIINLSLKKSAYVPDVLLVDEAGQVPLPLGYLLGRFWAGSVLLFGDDAQMPPVFSEVLKNDPLSKSLFEQLRSVDASSIVRLSKTYRMNNEITELVGGVFYSDAAHTDAIESDLSVANRRLRAHAPNLPNNLQELLTGHSVKVRLHRLPGSTQHNAAEAAEAVSIVEALVGSGVDSDEIAIVSPFRRQCHEIRTRLASSSLFRSTSEIPIVDTVERIQGTTVEVVVISYACSDSGFAGTIAEFLFSTNRLNVALSRARTRAIIFASEALRDAEPDTHQGMVALATFEKVLRSTQSLPHTPRDSTDR